MTHPVDRTALLRLGADYLVAYAARDAVTLFRLSDRWTDTELRDAACEVALVGFRAALGPSGLDAVCSHLRAAAA
ncbi:hypothetical protein [Luteimicrobium sp. DT211]|uniref:hypothetical protein n=1 Tax=Luteimicrobium sp. DT211 TaxID=3393412 RepID=UPI003CE8A6AB